MKPQGEVRADNTELIDSLLVYYRKKSSDSNIGKMPTKTNY